MELLKLLLEFAATMATPSVVLVIALLFRSEIKDLLRALARVRKAKLPGVVAMDFDAELNKAKQLADSIHGSGNQSRKFKPAAPSDRAAKRLAELGLWSSPSGLNLDRYAAQASASHTLALAGLRFELEISAHNLAKALQVAVEPTDSAATLYSKFGHKDILTREQADLAGRLLRLCSHAINGHQITTAQVTEMVAVAKVLLDDYFNWLAWSKRANPEVEANRAVVASDIPRRIFATSSDWKRMSWF